MIDTNWDRAKGLPTKSCYISIKRLGNNDIVVVVVGGGGGVLFPNKEPCITHNILNF